MRIISLLLAGISLLPILARAELSIIYDSGNTQPLAPFLAVFGETPPTAPAQGSPNEPGDLGTADLSRLLPIRSSGLTSGLVTRRALTLPNNGALPRPFFLIGADERSRAWLAMHHDQLLAIGAVGMLVQADSVRDLEAIARLADGLPILPASATDIAKALGLQHFPVLISRRGIEQ